MLHRSQGEALKSLLKYLAEDADDNIDVDPRLEIAAKLDSLALLQRDPIQAEMARSQAKYLRACVKYGIEEE